MSETRPGRVESCLVRVGVPLGKPTPVDPARPSEDGGATRINDPPDFPLYCVRKTCTATGHRGDPLYVGRSPRPQYDDEDPFPHACDRCIEREESARRERQRECAAERGHDRRKDTNYRSAARARRPGDPLDD